MDRSSSWTNANRNADYIPPSRVARMAIPSPRPPPGSTAEAVATARRAEHGTGGNILPILPIASPNASKRSSWTTPRSSSESLEDDSNESFAPPPRRAEMASMAATRRPEPVRQSDGLFASETEQAQLAYMEQMYGTINLLNAELESERRTRAVLEATAARPSTYPAMSDYLSFEEDAEPPRGFVVSQSPVAHSHSPRKLRTMPSPPSQPPHRVARPPTSPRSIVKEQDVELCTSLGKNAELRIRSRDMERTVEKTELELELARKQIKMAERRAENREEKLRALLKEKLNWQKELKATRAQVVEEKMRQVDLFREVEAAKRNFTAELDAIDQELRAVQEENSQLRTYATEMKAQVNFQARKLDEMARQAQDEKARFVAMIEDTRHRFREWKEGEADALEAAHEQAVRNLKTEYELKMERHQNEKQKLRDKVNDLEVSMRLLQKDRALSPLELSLRKAAILGSKESRGTVEAEQIETQSRVLELENLLAHSLEYQTRQESIIKLSEATISRLMQEREVTALENLSLHPFGVEQQLPRSEDLSYDTQLTGFMTAPSSPVRRMSRPSTPSRNHETPVKTIDPLIVRSPKSRSNTPRRAELEESITQAQEQDSTTIQSASIPSSREKNLLEELVQLRKELEEAKAKAVEIPVPSNNSEHDKKAVVAAIDIQEVHEVVMGKSSVNLAIQTDNTTPKMVESPRNKSDACEILTDDPVEEDTVAVPIEETSDPGELNRQAKVIEEGNPLASSELQGEPVASDAARDEINAQEADPVQVSSSEVTSSEDENHPSGVLAGEKLPSAVEITEIVTENAEDAVATQKSASSHSDAALEKAHPATDDEVHPDPTVNDETLAFEAGTEHFEADSSSSRDDDSSTANDQQELSVKDIADESLEVQNTLPKSPAASSQEPIPDELTASEESLPYEVNQTLLPSEVSVSNGSDDSDKEGWAEVQHCDIEATQADATAELICPSEFEMKEVESKDEELLVDETEEVPGKQELNKFLEEECKGKNAETNSLPNFSSEMTESQELVAESTTEEPSSSTYNLADDSNVTAITPQEPAASGTDGSEEMKGMKSSSIAVEEDIPELSVESVKSSAEIEAVEAEEIPKEVIDVGEDVLREIMQEPPAVQVPMKADVELETDSTGIDLAKNDIVHLDGVEIPNSAESIEFMEVHSTELEQTNQLAAAHTDEVEEYDDIHASETKIISELQEEHVESQPEILSPESGEVTSVPSSKSPETIVAEALVALVECAAISLLSSRGKNNDGTSHASLENSEDASALTASDVVEDVVVDSAEPIDSTTILNASSDECEASDGLSKTTEIDCNEVTSCEQVTKPIAAIDDANDTRTVVEESRTVIGELSASECGLKTPIEDSVTEKETLVAVVANEIAKNFVKEVIEMFDCAPLSSENQEVDDVVVVERSTKRAEDTTAATVEDNTVETSTTDADATVTTAEAQPTATIVLESCIAEAANVSPVDHGVDDKPTSSEPDIPVHAVQDLTIGSPVDTFVVARDFVDAVEREALSAVLESLQDAMCSDPFQAYSEHEHEEDELNSTRSICNLSSEEQDEYNNIIESEVGVAAIAVLTSGVVEDSNEICTSDVVDEVRQANSDPDEQQSSNDELAEIVQIVESCTATVESEVLANLSALTSTSGSFSNGVDIETHNTEEQIVREFSTQEIISDVACHFAPEVIAEELTKRCGLGENENMAADENSQQTNEIVSVVEENYIPIQETPPTESDSAPDEVNVAAFNVESGQESREVSESVDVEEVDGTHTLSMETTGEDADAVSQNPVEAIEPVAAENGTEPLAIDQEATDKTQATDDNVCVNPDASTPNVLVEAQPEDFVKASELVEAVNNPREITPLLNVETIPAADRASDFQSERDNKVVKLLLVEMTATIALNEDMASSADQENPDTSTSSSLGNANDLVTSRACIPVQDPLEAVCGLPNEGTEIELTRESDQISDATEENLSDTSGPQQGVNSNPSPALVENLSRTQERKDAGTNAIDGADTIDSVMTSIVDAICYPVELGVESCSMDESQTVDKPDDHIEDFAVEAFSELIDNTSVQAPDSTTEEPSAVELSAESTGFASEGNEVSTSEAETSESLDTNDARVEDPDKHGDIMPYAATFVGFTLGDDEAVVRCTLGNLVDSVTGGNDTLRSIDQADTRNASLDFREELPSSENDKFAEFRTAGLCTSVGKKVTPKHRARSVHFAQVDQSDRQHQERRSVLLWQAPFDTAFTKENVQNSAKRRASRKRTSRRTIADLLAFPTELARFTASDTTLLAYDARHEQGQQPCSLLDYSILNINPDGRHIHLDDQDERTGSKIIGKRKTLMQELHSKNLALRQIPRFNYMPMRINFQWSDFVVATPVPPSNTTCRYGEGHISKSPVEPLRLLQKKGAKLPCGTYVIVSAFIRPLEDGNENLRVQIYEAERVEEFQFDFSEDIMKKYHLESTGMEAQSLEFLGHLEFRRDEDTIIIKLPEKKTGDGGKTEGDRLQSERTMFGGGEPREPKQSKMSAFHNRPASS